MATGGISTRASPDRARSGGAGRVPRPGHARRGSRPGTCSGSRSSTCRTGSGSKHGTRRGTASRKDWTSSCSAATLASSSRFSIRPSASTVCSAFSSARYPVRSTTASTSSPGVMPRVNVKVLWSQAEKIECPVDVAPHCSDACGDVGVACDAQRTNRQLA